MENRASSPLATRHSPLFVGIDCGTSGVRAIAIDGGAQIQGQAAVDLPRAPRKGPGHTQDPLIWWRALEQVLDTLLNDLDRSRVSALAVDGTSATLLLADAAGTPLGHALLYDDARASAAAARIATVAPAESATRSATSSLAKLLYMLDQPGYALARHALHQADWIAGRLMGRYTHSDENNCLKLGYDPVARTWPAWLTTLGVDPALLPWPTAPGKAIGLLSEPVAQRFGLSTQVRVVAGTTDSTAAFIATGAQNPGDAVTSLGSTLVVKVLSTQPVFAPEYGVYSHRLDDRVAGRRRIEQRWRGVAEVFHAGQDRCADTATATRHTDRPGLLPTVRPRRTLPEQRPRTHATTHTAPGR